MVRGHLSPRFLPLDALSTSISRHTEWGVIGPRDHVFLGPAVALDGPVYTRHDDDDDDDIAVLTCSEITHARQLFAP